QRHQRRRTRRIHRHRRTLQPQRIRHPTRHHTARRTRQHIPLGRLRNPPQQLRIIVIHRPDENPRRRTRQRSRREPRTLHSLPTHLQHQPLLRIHRQRLTRRHPEQPRIKTRRIRQEPTTIGRGMTHRPRIRIEQRLIPTPVPRKTPHHLTTSSHHIPQLLRRTDPPRKTTPHPHNHHRVLLHTRTRRTRPRNRRNRTRTRTSRTRTGTNLPHQLLHHRRRRREIEQQ